MANNVITLKFEGKCRKKLIKWKVKSGNRLSLGTVVLLYHDETITEEGDSKNYQKLKSEVDGTVSRLVASENDIIEEGTPLLEYIQICSHSIVMKDLCAECGADLRELRKDDQIISKSASVSMVHSVPELRVSEEQAYLLGKADQQRLLQIRKLVLLVDLDQTLIHTTNDNVPPNLKDVYHFQLYGSRSMWYHTRLRPSLSHFLEKISQHYELHICSFGARLYAHTVARFMDPNGKYFSHRILSRDECFNPTSKTANLKSLFPCGDSLVCIIDDREDVWNFAPNLIHVKPYHYFLNTGDINAPPGLEKMEDNVNKPPNTAATSPVLEKVGENESTNESSSSSKDEEASKSDSKCSKPLTENCDNTEKINVEDKQGDKGNDSDLKDTNSVLTPPKILEQKDEKLPQDDSKDIHLELKSLNDLKQTNEIKSEESLKTVETNAEKNLPENDETPESKSDSPKDNDATVTEESENVSKEIEYDEYKLDEDDYLLYLEEILLTLHKAFYDLFDQTQNKDEIPDLKMVVPYVRKKILKGVNIVFSGVIPTNVNPEKSKPWLIAKSLGANVSNDVIFPKPGEPHTTHVVAARLGTVKLNKARKIKGVRVITLDWLWCCSERWERVDERLFPLTKDTVVQLPGRKHHAMASVPQPQQSPNFSETNRPTPVANECPVYDPVTGKRIRSKNEAIAGSSNDALPGTSQTALFSDSVNPYFSFSTQQLAEMGKEVADACSEDSGNSSDSSSSSNGGKTCKRKNISKIDLESSDCESLSGGSVPTGWKREKTKRTKLYDEDDDTENKVIDCCSGILDADEDSQPINPNRDLSYDSDKSVSHASNSDDFNDSVGSVDSEMAAAVEREFLS